MKRSFTSASHAYARTFNFVCPSLPRRFFSCYLHGTDDNYIFAASKKKFMNDHNELISLLKPKFSLSPERSEMFRKYIFNYK